MDERVLITGGACGIGRAIAERCREAGWTPVVIDRDDAELRADLSDPASTAAALERALAGGPITRLVNNVGTIRPATLEAQTLDDLAAVLSLNLRCAMQCAQAVLPGMKAARFGRIVNISSRAALGKSLRTAYAASKAGLQGMAKVWALELGPHGITANAIGPGPIRTALFESGNPPDSPATRRILEGVPVGRMGEPEDVAHATAFLLDRRSGFVTGQVLYVCGGMTVGLADS